MSAKGGIKKLTMVSTIVRGRRVARFVEGVVVQKRNSVTGKSRDVTIVDRNVLERALSGLSRGETYSVG